MSQGIAKIVDDDNGDGTYTITSLRWNGAAYVASTGLGGLVAANARDIDNRTVGVADQVVFYWTQGTVGGGLEIIIDVVCLPAGGDEHYVLQKDSADDYDMVWGATGMIPAGGDQYHVLQKDSADDYDAVWGEVRATEDP